MKTSERIVFLSKNAIEICDRFSLIIQEKQAGKGTNSFDDETFAIIAALLDYKCVTAIE